MLTRTRSAVARWWGDHTRCADFLMGVGLILLSLGASWPSLTGPDSVVPVNGWWVLAVGAALCVGACTVRRRLPYACWLVLTTLPLVVEGANALAGTGGADPTYAVTAFGPVSLLGVPVAVGTIAALRSPAAAWACAVLSAVLAQVSDQLAAGAAPTSGDWFYFVYFLSFYLFINAIGALVGMYIRAQRERLVAVEERSARLALAREQTALLAAANERSRIAREMHDVVAHSLAVMITMADGAAAAVERNPEMAKEALSILSETGRSALADTRRLVGVLRDDPGATSDPAARAGTPEGTAAKGPGASGTGPDAAARPVSRRRGSASSPATAGSVPVVRDVPVPEFAPPGTVVPEEPTEEIVALRRRATSAGTDTTTGDIPMAPAPEQSDLRVLVDRFRAAGVPLEYRWTGGPLPEDKALQLTLFRIAQESMTNILRYAPTTRSVRVSVDRHTGTAVLTVDNDAAPGSTPVHGSGKGLIGMRERAAVYGGTVEAGPTQTGWRVRAVLRWDEDDEGTSPWQMPL